MTHSKEGCPDGWDPAELLAYLEEDVGPSTRAAVEEHLKRCSICSDELDSLRKWDALLREHPESFHPDPEDLYRLVSHGEDPGGHTKNHVESCRDCTEAVQLLREMLSAQGDAPEPSQVIPGSLVSKLEELYRIPGRASHREPLSSFFHRLLGIRFRLPVLALGTAAAAVIIVVLVMPRPAIFREPPRPGAVAPAEAPRRSIGPEQAPSATDQFRLSDEQTRENAVARSNGNDKGISSTTVLTSTFASIASRWGVGAGSLNGLREVFSKVLLVKPQSYGPLLHLLSLTVNWRRRLRLRRRLMISNRRRSRISAQREWQNLVPASRSFTAGPAFRLACKS